MCHSPTTRISVLTIPLPFRMAMSRVLLFSLWLAGLPVAKAEISWDHNMVRQPAPIVETVEGPVRGFFREGVYEFLGVPYAAPPVGALRWMPPAPGIPWTDPRDATQFGHHCPQIMELGSFAGPPSVSEDCLYLNVFTTQLNRGSAPAAVLIWIHGGGNFDGESDDYDASKLATGGPFGIPTVVVTLNYRLGLFGFLAHPALDVTGRPFANYGIMDIQAAMRWVKRNIGAFGGDPTRVALAGQSAGAINTAINLMSPLAKGLFNRVILQSGPEYGMEGTIPLSVGLAAGVAFAEAAGCPGDDSQAATCLRKLSVSRILQLEGTSLAIGPYQTGPMVDGTVIPTAPGQAFRMGQFERMPIMAGNTADEVTFGSILNGYLSEAQLPDTRREHELGGRSAFSLPLRPTLTEGRVKCQALHMVHIWSKFVPVYQYEFDYQSAPFYFPHVPGLTPLASHTSDIQFLFKNWHGGILGVNLDQDTGQPRELNGPETQLSDRLVAFITKFVDSGNPNGSGDTPWPKFTTQPGRPAILSENIPELTTFTDTDFAAQYHCATWDRILGFAN